jgi:Flp pilus assembly secretin CpaC
MGLRSVVCAAALLAMLCGVSPATCGFAADQSAAHPLGVIDATLELRVASGRGRVLRSSVEVRRTAVADPTVMEILQVSPSEFVVLGRHIGTTHLTVWPGDTLLPPVVILVHVAANH